jgi:hypothetical protein
MRVCHQTSLSKSKAHSISFLRRKGRMSHAEILMPREFRADLVAFINATSVILGPPMVLCPTKRHSIFPSRSMATLPSVPSFSIQPKIYITTSAASIEIYKVFRIGFELSCHAPLGSPLAGSQVEFITCFLGVIYSMTARDIGGSEAGEKNNFT